jgi:hypothetical protein
MKRVSVKLVRKLAECIDGVDISMRSVGDTFSLPANDARLLLAEGWAVQVGARPAPRRTERPDPSRLPAEDPRL